MNEYLCGDAQILDIRKFSFKNLAQIDELH